MSYELVEISVTFDTVQYPFEFLFKESYTDVIEKMVNVIESWCENNLDDGWSISYSDPKIWLKEVEGKLSKVNIDVNLQPKIWVQFENKTDAVTFKLVEPWRDRRP